MGLLKDLVGVDMCMVMERFRYRILEINKGDRNVSMKGSPYEGEGGRWGGLETRATGGARGRETDAGEETGIHSPQDKLSKRIIKFIG